jgi:hypothetical protein
MKPVNRKQCPGCSEGRPVRWRPVLRKAGLILTAVSGALLSSTLSLPWYVPALATLAGLGGSILTILSQPDPPGEGGGRAEGVSLR